MVYITRVGEFSVYIAQGGKRYFFFICIQNNSYIYDAEHETDGSLIISSSVHHYNVFCAVCLTQNRYVVNMFPGKIPTIDTNCLMIIYH